MRLWTFAKRCAAALALMTAGLGAPASAQGTDELRYPGLYQQYYSRQPVQQPQRQRRVRDPYAGYPQAYPSARNPYYPQPRYYYPNQGYGYGYAPAPEDRRQLYERRPIPQEARRPQDYVPRKKVRRVAPAAPAVAARPKEDAKPEVAEVEPSTTIVVFGDSLAELVAEGLDEAYEEANDVEVVSKAKADTGLARLDAYDWPKTIQDYVSGKEKITFAVLMMGSNDRQAIREGDATHDPLSDRWRELYGARVDAVLRPLVEKKIPFVWVGAPPMRSNTLSETMSAVNDITRDRVQRAGGIFADIWSGFVTDENKYAATGPNLSGQVTRLRLNDGVHFTQAGARKAAHFAERELKRLIEQRNAGTAVATVPAAPGLGGDPAAPKDVDQLISASLPSLPEPQGLPSLPSKPVAGPVLPLTRPETSPGGQLVNARPKLDGDAAYLVDRALRQGVAPTARPGRADDFKWPRS